MTLNEMRAAVSRKESRSEWERVRRNIHSDPAAAEENRQIEELIASKRGRPVVGEPKVAISLRIPESVLAAWKATGPGWQTRMVQRLSTK
ncbi:MAG: BrnA antitoxin family protein [Pigmentiphaga sp.]|nr:BrnA antitoxin family protein [Pigmentiphaga sp.]